MVTKEEAISLLKEQLSQIKSIRALGYESSLFKRWRRDTDIIIENIFGKKSRQISEYISITYQDPDSYNIRIGEKYIPSGFSNGLNEAETLLQSMIIEIERFGLKGSEKDVSIKKDVKSTILLICDNFHIIVRQLRKRHENRETLDVQDEYDVQDLLHALLRLYFDDIRPEEWTPEYAGSSSRMDFLLKKEKIVLETKMTRKNLLEKQIGDQLIVDIAKYKQHPDCKELICFVYDPEGRISSPRGLENDLSRKNDIIVNVFIRPQQ